MSSARKYGAKTGDTRFKLGNPGRPRGARHKTTLAIEALLDGQAEALTQKAIELALRGDMTAIKLCLDRIAPPRKGRPTPLALPAVDTAQGVQVALTAIVAAVAGGVLSPEEGGAVAGLIETARRSLETVELEARVRAIEERHCDES